MSIKKQRFYSFRSRLMWGLYISAAFAGVISLMLAYVVSHMSVQSELRLQQQAIAVYMLELDSRTDLMTHEILALMDDVEATHVELVSDDMDLPEDLIPLLMKQAILTVQHASADTPVTYVRLADGMARITSLYGKSLFLVAFFRIITTALSYLAVFVLMVTFTSFRLSKPVNVLTRAFEQVKEGDFTVRLPDTAPGEMGDAMRSFNDMTEALGSTSYMQKDFISSISHEFKTPIASIRGFAKMLQMPGLSEEQKSEYINLIAQESDRLSRLSETLLRLSALEQQTALSSLNTFALDEQIRQVILRLEPTWSAKDIDWDLEDMEEISITSDEELISHVWINIIQNAIKFSPQGSEIAVRLHGGDSAVVEIQDHGCGMTDEAIGRIFDRFYQADKSRKQEGVGLGLCLVKRILDMMGGTVTVTSKVGEGSTFRVVMPLHPPKYQERQTEALNHG